MNMQQMIQAMNKVQRQYEKDKKVLDDKSFEYTANGVVTVTLKGDYSMVGISFADPDVLKEDPEMVSDLIKLAYDGAKALIDKANDELVEKYQKNATGGLPF